MPRTISVASYIFKRLQQNGVNHVFGVPGDYMLKALDHVKATGVKWTGTCNELNAGYAADGYARINGLGALFTTYGKSLSPSDPSPFNHTRIMNQTV